MTSFQNILTIDVEDYFQASAFDRCVLRSHWDQLESRVEKNTLKILGMLEARSISATFFVLGWVAKRHPGLVNALHSAGHEVGCHGYSHRLVFEQTPNEFRQETRKAKALLQDIIGAAVWSYRAASYSITRRSAWALEILAEEGFRYDSSIFPIVHDRYGIPTAPRGPFHVQLSNGAGLVEFPMSTVRMFGMNLPVAGGGYFRLLPYSVTCAAIRRLHRMDKLPLNFYLHPWELDPDQPKQPVGGLTRIRHYLNLHKTVQRFEQLLNDFSFAPLRSVAASLEYPSVTSSQLFGTSSNKSA